jgi:hypothetical protein
VQLQQPPPEPSPEEVTEMLDSIPGAYEALQEGLDQARRGLGIPLDELVAQD